MNVNETFKVLKTMIVEGTDNVATIYWQRNFVDPVTSLETVATGVTETVAQDDSDLIPLASITDEDLRGFVMDCEGENWIMVGEHCTNELAYKVRQASYVTHEEREGYTDVFGQEETPVEVI